MTEHSQGSGKDPSCMDLLIIVVRGATKEPLSYFRNVTSILNASFALELCFINVHIFSLIQGRWFFFDGFTLIFFVNLHTVSWITVMNTLQLSLALLWVRWSAQSILFNACVNFGISLLGTLICSGVVFCPASTGCCGGSQVSPENSGGGESHVSPGSIDGGGYRASYASPCEGCGRCCPPISIHSWLWIPVWDLFPSLLSGVGQQINEPGPQSGSMWLIAHILPKAWHALCPGISCTGDVGLPPLCSGLFCDSLCRSENAPSLRPQKQGEEDLRVEPAIEKEV